MLNPSTLRKKYLDFFTNKSHAVIPSASLVPENDPTTLFNGSGMQPLVPFLLGKTHPKGKRLVDSQKCFRSQDIEEVGDNRHITFFEMLGNWSLGDYFKKEQLRFFFEFLTKEAGIKPDRLFVTVFAGDKKLGIPRDKDSVAIWQELFKEMGVQTKAVDVSTQNKLEKWAADSKLQENKDHIFYYSSDKNWWSRSGVPENMPAGEPGGPDSEVFFDFGEEHRLHESSPFSDQPCHVNCDCGRYLEIGNSVFMEYIKEKDGSFSRLSQKNVDFGGGLERILAAALDEQDIFKTPSFTAIISKLEEISGVKYDLDLDHKRSFRVIADHVKAAVMLVADGVEPSNKAQGYVSRRLIRRAIRFGKMIGITQPFIAQLIPVVIEQYAKAYPSVALSTEKIKTVLAKEENKFRETLEKGLKRIEKLEKLDGQVAFKLYETYGFPFELTQEIAQERGQKLERDEFDKALKSHSQMSRTASAGVFKGGLADSSEQTTSYHTATHLLHAALRKILGEHVMQKGSHITGSRLRFDFTHPEAVTTSQLRSVEDQINTWIQADLPVTQQTQPKDKAIKSGAIAFFADKYSDEVSVYTIGADPEKNWVSKELCGGPHVKHTGEIGKIELYKEKSASSGVRRVYARAS